MAMACSAVVMELPKRRVHHDDAALGCLLDIHVVNANTGATDDLEIVGSGDDFFGCLGGRPNGQTVVLADDLDQLVFVLAQIRQVVNFDDPCP